MAKLKQAKVPMCPKCKVELEYLNIGDLFLCRSCGRRTNYYFRPVWGYYSTNEKDDQ